MQLETTDSEGHRFLVGDRVYNHVDKCDAVIIAIAKPGVVTLQYDDMEGVVDTTVNYLTNWDR